jgi:hypothetical protein
MGFLDPALRKISCVAVILMSRSASEALRMSAGATDCWHNQVTRLQAADGRTDLHDLCKRLVSDHQVVISTWWSAIFEGADLPVRTTDTDVEHAEHDLVRFSYMWSFVLDELDFVGLREYCDGFHDISSLPVLPL